MSTKSSPKKKKVLGESRLFTGGSLQVFPPQAGTESLFVLSSYQLLFRGYYS